MTRRKNRRSLPKAKAGDGLANPPIPRAPLAEKDPNSMDISYRISADKQPLHHSPGEQPTSTRRPLAKTSTSPINSFSQAPTSKLQIPTPPLEPQDRTSVPQHSSPTAPIDCPAMSNTPVTSLALAARTPVGSPTAVTRSPAVVSPITPPAQPPRPTAPEARSTNLNEPPEEENSSKTLAHPPPPPPFDDKALAWRPSSRDKSTGGVKASTKNMNWRARPDPTTTPQTPVAEGVDRAPLKPYVNPFLTHDASRKPLELADASAQTQKLDDTHSGEKTSESYSSYWNKKERTAQRKFKPVARNLLKPGVIFHTPKEIPQKSIARNQVDKGWWSHPVLVMDYDRKTGIAEVLLITTLRGKLISEMYRDGVSMRRRLLYIWDSGDNGRQENKEGMPRLHVQDVSSNLYTQSYVKINRPVRVEAQYLLHLSMNRTVALEPESVVTVRAVLSAWLASPDAAMVSTQEMQDDDDAGAELDEVEDPFLSQALATGNASGAASPSASHQLVIPMADAQGKKLETHFASLSMGSVGVARPRQAKPEKKENEEPGAKV